MWIRLSRGGIRPTSGFHVVNLSIAEAEDYSIVIREGSALLKAVLNCLEIVLHGISYWR